MSQLPDSVIAPLGENIASESRHAPGMASSASASLTSTCDVALTPKVTLKPPEPLNIFRPAHFRRHIRQRVIWRFQLRQGRFGS